MAKRMQSFRLDEEIIDKLERITAVAGKELQEQFPALDFTKTDMFVQLIEQEYQRFKETGKIE